MLGQASRHGFITLCASRAFPFKILFLLRSIVLPSRIVHPVMRSVSDLWLKERAFSGHLTSDVRTPSTTDQRYARRDEPFRFGTISIRKKNDRLKQNWDLE